MNKAQKSTRYPAEFKESAVQLALESDEPISKTAEGLGVNINTLHNWIGKYGSSLFQVGRSNSSFAPIR